MIQLVIRVLSLMFVVLAFASCTSTNVTGPTCNASAGATSSTGASGNADGVGVGSDATGSGQAGCVGGGIAQE